MTTAAEELAKWQRVMGSAYPISMRAGDALVAYGPALERLVAAEAEDELMQTQFRIMQQEKEHGWREAERWESAAERAEAENARLRAALDNVEALHVEIKSEGDGWSFCDYDGFSHPCATIRAVRDAGTPA